MKTKKELSIYVHIPFCVKKCKYCDFLSFSSAEAMRASYVDALCHEISFYGNREREVVSVYLGGGTPSILEGVQIERIMKEIREHFVLWEEAEITLEANPGTLNQEKLAAYRRAGINRLSLGLQSAHNRELEAIGRIHTWEQFLDNYREARKAGFTNISVDLMSALPDQTPEAYTDSLHQVAGLKPEHISAYSLIIEEGTPFYEEEDMESRLPPEETEREMYYCTRKILEEYGYYRYEISNYSLPGKESRHNTGYWTGREYLGLGLGAASFYQGARYCNERNLERYQEIWQETDKTFGTAQGQEKKPEDISRRVRDYHMVTRQEAMEEFMFLGLRMSRGISSLEFEKRFQQPLDRVYGKEIDRLEREGLIFRDKEYVKLTDNGIDVSNYALSRFLFC